jgi:NAD(P)H-hydrate epimerase
MFVLSPDEMKRFDQITVQKFGIADIILMENAGKKAAEIMETEILDEDDSVAVFCGTGNNGGDGMVIARWLFNHGYDVCCYIIGDEKKFSPLAMKNYEILQRINCEIQFIQNQTDAEKLTTQILEFDAVVDAIFGIGLKGKVTGYRENVIKAINDYANLVISIDIASGVNARNGKVANIAIQADYTITMGDLKYGHLLFPGRELSGKTFIVDIGIPPKIYADNFPKAEILTDISEFLPPRPIDSHKGDFGKVAVIAGSPGLTGAGIMASNAALEMGSGLITLLHPKSLSHIFESSLVEVMTKSVAETEEKTISVKALDEISSFVKKCDAAAIGPGISRNSETAKLVRNFLSKNNKPTVIDADAINAYENHSDELRKLSKKPYIFTPHIKEFSRLSGLSIKDIKNDELGCAVRFAEKYKIVLLLKGSTSIITDGEQITFNITGNPGLSTGGSGDVLTGIILALLGQRLLPYDAARVGAYIHGRTADILSEEIGEASVTPTKLIKNISRVFLEYNEES